MKRSEHHSTSPALGEQAANPPDLNSLSLPELLAEARRHRDDVQAAANEKECRKREADRAAAEKHWQALLAAIAKEMPGALVPCTNLVSMPEDFSAKTGEFWLYVILPKQTNGTPPVIAIRYANYPNTDKWLPDTNGWTLDRPGRTTWQTSDLLLALAEALDRARELATTTPPFEPPADTKGGEDVEIPF